MKLTVDYKIKAIGIPLVIALVFYFLNFPLWIVFGELAVAWGFLIIYPLLKDREYIDPQDIALDYAKTWWKEKVGEDLTMSLSQGFSQYFGVTEESRVFVFRIIRSNNAPVKPSMPLIIIVKLYPKPTILDWDDKMTNTNNEKWVNPLKDISPTLVGAPVPDIRTDIQAKLRQPEKKKKTEAEEKKDELEENKPQWESEKHD